MTHATSSMSPSSLDRPSDIVDSMAAMDLLWDWLSAINRRDVSAMLAAQRRLRSAHCVSITMTARREAELGGHR